MSSASKRLIEQFNDPSAWDHVGEEYPVMIEHTMCQFADGTKHAVVKGKAIPEGAKVLYDVDAARIDRIYRNAKRNFELHKPIKLFREHSNVPGSERVGWYGEPKLADWNGLKAIVTRRYVEKGKGDSIKGYVERSPEYFPRVDELSAVALLPPRTEPRLAMGIEAETYSGEHSECMLYAGDLLPEYYKASSQAAGDRGSGPLPEAKPKPVLNVGGPPPELSGPIFPALMASKLEMLTRKHYTGDAPPHRAATDSALEATRSATDKAGHDAAAKLHDQAAALHQKVSAKHKPKWYHLDPSQKQVDLHHDHRRAATAHREAAEMHRNLGSGEGYSLGGAETYKASYPSGYGDRGERGAGPLKIKPEKPKTKPDVKASESPTPELDYLDHPAGKWALRAYRSGKTTRHRSASSTAFASTYRSFLEGGSHADAASAHLNAASLHGSAAGGERNSEKSSVGEEAKSQKFYRSHKRAFSRHLKAAMEHMRADAGVMKSHKEWHDAVVKLHKDDVSEDYAMPDDIQNPTPQPADPTGVPNGSQVDLSPEEQQAAALVVQAMAGNPKLLTIIATALFQSIPEFGYLKAMAEQAMSSTPIPSPPQPAATSPSPQGGPGVAPTSPPPQMMASDQAREEYAARLAEADALLHRAKAEKKVAEDRLADSEARRIMAAWNVEGIKYSHERESAALIGMSPAERTKHDKHVREFYSRTDRAPVGGPPIPVNGVNTMEMEAYSPPTAEIERVLHENKWDPANAGQWDQAKEIAKKRRFDGK